MYVQYCRQGRSLGLHMCAAAIAKINLLAQGVLSRCTGWPKLLCMHGPIVRIRVEQPGIWIWLLWPCTILSGSEPYSAYYVLGRLVGLTDVCVFRVWTTGPSPDALVVLFHVPYVSPGASCGPLIQSNECSNAHKYSFWWIAHCINCIAQRPATHSCVNVSIR